jgi:hypothetical protein
MVERPSEKLSRTKKVSINDIFVTFCFAQMLTETMPTYVCPALAASPPAAELRIVRSNPARV